MAKSRKSGMNRRRRKTRKNKKNRKTTKNRKHGKGRKYRKTSRRTKGGGNGDSTPQSEPRSRPLISEAELAKLIKQDFCKLRKPEPGGTISDDRTKELSRQKTNVEGTGVGVIHGAMERQTGTTSRPEDDDPEDDEDDLAAVPEVENVGWDEDDANFASWTAPADVPQPKPKTSEKKAAAPSESSLPPSSASSPADKGEWWRW